MMHTASLNRKGSFDTPTLRVIHLWSIISCWTIFFNYFKSSTALFNLVVNDDHSVVKQQALEMFENHPLSNKSIPEHRDIILRYVS